MNARRDAVTARLAAAGCVAAGEEADELVGAARDAVHLDELVRRRCAGEPLAWLTGSTRFCGARVRVACGVYVPRWQTEALARTAAGRLPPTGVAIDLCTGTGAVGVAMAVAKPRATVVAADVDEAAVACARVNGVVAYLGDLFEPLPHELRGRVDVVTAVTPYVPTDSIPLLAATAEPKRALDGGADGLAVVARVTREAPRWLRPGGMLVVEIGAPQVVAATALFDEAGFTERRVLHDPDGDVAGLAGVRSRPAARPI